MFKVMQDHGNCGRRSCRSLMRRLLQSSNQRVEDGLQKTDWQGLWFLLSGF
jgi:hypothetical protein